MNRVRSTPFVKWTLAPVVFLLWTTAAVAEVSGAFDMGIRWDDNIGFSPDEDKVQDWTLELGAGVDWNFVQTQTTEVGIHAGLFHREVADTQDISHYGFVGSAHYRGQSGPELTAFWWSLDGEIETREHRDSKVRDGYLWEVSATIGKRFNQTFGLSGGYRYERREATEDTGSPDQWRADEVFDLKKDVFFIAGDFALGAVTNLNVTFSYKDGTEATTGRYASTFPPPVFGPMGASIPWDLDPAFGPDYQVWKVDAEQYILDFLLSHSFTEKFSIEAGYSYVDAEGTAWIWPNDYKNHVFTATIAYQI